MGRKLLRVFCGIIAFVLSGLLAVYLHDRIGHLKPNEYKDVILTVSVLFIWIILFGLVALKKYPGDLTSFLTWLIVIPLMVDLSDRLVRYGLDYFHIDIVIAYLILFITLIAIALPRRRRWPWQILLFIVVIVVSIGSLQWIDESNTLRQKLADLDMQIRMLHEHLDGTTCYVPLSNMTEDMVKAKLGDIDKILTFMHTYLPDKPPLEKFRKEVYVQANLNKLQVKNFEFTTTNKLDFYAENIFKGEVIGSKEQYEKFKLRLENMPWLISWNEDSTTRQSYVFDGRLYSYMTVEDIARKKLKFKHATKVPGPAAKIARCELSKPDDMMWPPNNARLANKREEYKAICQKQLPFENILNLESKLKQKKRDAISRFTIIHHLGKKTNNRIVKSYKANIPTDCYRGPNK